LTETHGYNDGPTRDGIHLATPGDGGKCGRLPAEAEAAPEILFEGPRPLG